MDAVLKIGDVVQLKSGGPAMTVAELYGKDAVACVWFEGNDHHRELFHPDTLVAA